MIMCSALHNLDYVVFNFIDDSIIVVYAPAVIA